MVHIFLGPLRISVLQMGGIGLLETKIYKMYN